MQIKRDGNIGNECCISSGKDIPGEKVSGNKIQDDLKHESKKVYSPGEIPFVSKTNLENFMETLQHPSQFKETLSNLYQPKSISKMNLPMVDCTQSSSEVNVVQHQNQSIPFNLERSIAPSEHPSSYLPLKDEREIQNQRALINLEDSIGPLEHTSKSISKSKIEMNLPLQNDVFPENQPVPSDLEDSMAPLKHPSLSLSSSKSKIKMNLPLNNDVFQSHPVITNLEIFMDPLQNPFKSKETISNSSPSKQLSKINLHVVDCKCRSDLSLVYGSPRTCAMTRT
ncbi:hypothetical protein ROZALSC1DRAFT_25568 [Rozella allomycis CSF55]|uniref:Uncharacterized protein n=1 Tax=Rozella allomycis (strain CSF55) TaxID=988480 RepID=A0A4P9YB49_ROZAC|nr:hypothetical protein ROZALSC1DRAFT_25568 [Rozella allomycis CSF55]